MALQKFLGEYFLGRKTQARFKNYVRFTEAFVINGERYQKLRRIATFNHHASVTFGKTLTNTATLLVLVESTKDPKNILYLGVTEGARILLSLFDRHQNKVQKTYIHSTLGVHGESTPNTRLQGNGLEVRVEENIPDEW